MLLEGKEWRCRVMIGLHSDLQYPLGWKVEKSPHLLERIYCNKKLTGVVVRQWFYSTDIFKKIFKKLNKLMVSTPACITQM